MRLPSIECKRLNIFLNLDPPPAARVVVYFVYWRMYKILGCVLHWISINKTWNRIEERAEIVKPQLKLIYWVVHKNDSAHRLGEVSLFSYEKNQQIPNFNLRIFRNQAWAELGQAQLKLGLDLDLFELLG